MKELLVVDVGCEVYDLIKHLADREFWDFSQHKVIPNSVYVIGRDAFVANLQQIKQLLDSYAIKIVLCNSTEGSATLRDHIKRINMQEYVYRGQLLLISGGDMGPQWDYLLHESFMPKILDYEENIAAIKQANESKIEPKPYQFLFLNGRIRPHRKYLLERWQRNKLLDNALWTNLDHGPAGSKYIHLWQDGVDLLTTPSQPNYLLEFFEVSRYRNNIGRSNGQQYVKSGLFGGEWGEIYIEPRQYTHTYFSVVTETVFEYQYSFRTEKIWKPIAMGHPWIAVANPGYYRDLRDLGFKTFNHIIDEHFDFVEVPQERIEYVAQVVEDLCKQDLAAFQAECYNVCKYNQQHLAEMSQQVRKQFPDRFIQYIKAHGWMI